VIVAVNDPLLPGNSITVAITPDGAGQSDRRPQLHVDVAGLAAVLLGGATWRSVAVAGLARAQDPAVLAVADRLFAVGEAPHAGFFF
jgi:Sterol carrier protein domain